MPWVTTNQGATVNPLYGWSWFGSVPDVAADLGAAVWELSMPDSPHRFIDIVVTTRNPDDTKSRHVPNSNLEVWGGIGTEIGPYGSEIIAEVAFVDHADPTIVYARWIHEELVDIDLSNALSAVTRPEARLQAGLDGGL